MKTKKIFLIWMCLAVVIIGVGVLFKIKDKKNTIYKTSNQTAVSDYTNDEIVDISKIQESMKGELVSIEGVVIDIKEHKNGHLFLTVKDSTGSILVPIFADKGIDKDTLKKDKEYKISGKVDIYNGSLEIIPENQEDISIIEKSASNQLSITTENINKQVSINCKVLSKYDHPDGHIFLKVLTDNNEEIEIPIFNTLGYNTEAINSGSYIKVNGKISEYKGRLQVIPNSKNDIEIVSDVTINDNKLLSISDITENDRGKVIQVKGAPTKLVEKNGNIFLYLQDGQSKIKAVLFKADGNEIEGRKEKLKEYENLNKPVRVLGTVDIYNNELEIIIDKVYNQD